MTSIHLDGYLRPLESKLLKNLAGIVATTSTKKVPMRNALPVGLLSMLGMLTSVSASGGRAEGGSKLALAENGRAITVQNYYYALPGKAEEVYQWRLHASEVRIRLGLASGRVLKRTPVPGVKGDSELPDVIWECDYPDSGARTTEFDRLSTSREFDEVEAHMDTLLRRFSRGTFSVASGS